MDPLTPGASPISADTSEAMERVAKAREASAYAAGAAKASWEALIRAADHAREAADAWLATEDADVIHAAAQPADETDPVAIAEATVISALPTEARRRLQQRAHTAALRAREAREIAEFTGNLALQSAREWAEAEAAWVSIKDVLASGEGGGGDREDESATSIEITANGTCYSIEAASTVADFIESRGLPVDSCIAELNGVALNRSELSSRALVSGDTLEIVRAVAGGSGVTVDAGTDRRAQLTSARLYFVCSARKAGSELEQLVRSALDGGAGIVQLRDHEASDSAMLTAALAIRSITSEAGGLFIVNDRADVAMLASADGVHAGQDDLSPGQLRRLLGPDLLIGLSTHSEAEINSAQTSGADYIGVGPVFETPTKEGRPEVGACLVTYAASHSALPFFAIGGIDASRAGVVAEAGATRIAVVRAIEDAPDPRTAAIELCHAIATGAAAGAASRS